jgi:hypothetical protein
MSNGETAPTARRPAIVIATVALLAFLGMSAAGGCAPLFGNTMPAECWTTSRS